MSIKKLNLTPVDPKEYYEISHKLGLPVGEFKKLVNKIQKGERESRIAKKEKKFGFISLPI